MTATWRDQAVCRGMDPEFFHPSRQDVAGQLAAKAVCATCPVTAECLAYAVSFRGHDVRVHGVWGGTSDKQRRQMMRRPHTERAVA